MRSELGLKEGQKYAGVTRIIRVLNELSVRSWQLFLPLETTEDSGPLSLGPRLLGAFLVFFLSRNVVCPTGN